MDGYKIEWIDIFLTILYLKSPGQNAQSSWAGWSRHASLGGWAWLQHVWRDRVCPGCPGCLPPPGAHAGTQASSCIPIHHPPMSCLPAQDLSSIESVWDMMWCVNCNIFSPAAAVRSQNVWSLDQWTLDDLMPRVCTIALFLRLSVSGPAHRAGHSFAGIASNCYHTP